MGFACVLAALRYPGRPLADSEVLSLGMLWFLARQIGADHHWNAGKPTYPRFEPSYAKPSPLAAVGADQLVLASTHFTLLKPTIRAEFGDAFGFVDSAATVTAEVASTLRREGLSVPEGEGGSTTYLFTGNLEPTAVVPVSSRDGL
ncbi:hypothetical protein EFQ99_29390 [Rhizobium vallis]|uniref:Uncharacterized protein n=1 Tax=Rhizobium vallis TaxID=634290 RepID=A0A432PDF1_9HYPH|nr:hypothetical protein EFQ99_29390 [Rhizobium vallis]